MTEEKNICSKCYKEVMFGIISKNFIITCDNCYTKKRRLVYSTLIWAGVCILGSLLISDIKIFLGVVLLILGWDISQFIKNKE